jgi:hypothetical protein
MSIKLTDTQLVMLSVAAQRNDRCLVAALSRYRNDDAKRDCCAELQAASTTSRHVPIAAARSVRCVWAEVRWRWTLKML